MDKATYSRRSFLNRLWLLLSTLALAELAALLIAFFRPRKSVALPDRQEMLVEAGKVENFEPGTVTAFVRGKFYLARLEDGGFLALSRNCTHLNCTVPWVSDENRFICPCHSSEFDLRGDILRAPAPRALDLYAVLIRNDRVIVDTGKLIKRNEFSAEQVTYPKST